MILQALVHHYEQLLKRGELEAPGWSPVKVSYLLELEDSGEVSALISIKKPVQRGKKTVMVSPSLPLPTPLKRSGKHPPANFLADNSAYILGIDNKSEPEKALERFETCKKLHYQLLNEVDHPAAKAVLRYFDNWKPEDIKSNPVFFNDIEDICNGDNITFRYQGTFLYEIDSIRQAWDNHNRKEKGIEGVCLVTGMKTTLARIHPNIKGVAGAQSSGASLVSFDKAAFCSYGKEQGMNAPTGSYAAFAYGAALNDLLSKQRLRMGDTTLLLWADNAEPVYTEVMARAMDINAFFLQERNYDERDLMDALEALAKGHSVEFNSQRLDPNMTFYILGLAPNAARLSVRFFLRNSFGNFVKNVMAHHQRMEIVRPKFEPFPTVSLKSMLEETVNQKPKDKRRKNDLCAAPGEATINQKAKDKSPKPGLAGEVLRAILNDTRYPASLLHGVHLRIRADHEINRSRAAIIKAYYLKNQVADVPKEVLTVSLNPDASNTAYQLGRLFALLEEIQENASDSKLNTTIKDRYFSSASATPSVVFPTLMNLAQNHLARLRKKKTEKKPDLFVYYSKQLGEIMDKLDETYPTQQTLPQQGSFQIGYYHQTQYRYTKKEDK